MSRARGTDDGPLTINEKASSSPPAAETYPESADTLLSVPVLARSRPTAAVPSIRDWIPSPTTGSDW